MLGDYVFEDVPTDIPVYVPAESQTSYRTAEGWKDFTNLKSIEDRTGLAHTPVLARSITVCGSDILIESADALFVSLYDVNGRLVYQGCDRRIAAPGAGVYVVVAGQEAVKVMVRE